MSVQTVVLIGAMGSGKSHIARELARITRWPIRDIDAAVACRAGKSIATIFAEEGEPAFRAMETEALQHALEIGGIIATGGGVITQEANRTLLEESGFPVVYLRATPQTLAARIRLQPGTRPLIDGGGTLTLEQTEARVAEILEARAPLYESCATTIIETDGDVPREVAHRIRALCEAAMGTKIDRTC